MPDDKKMYGTLVDKVTNIAEVETDNIQLSNSKTATESSVAVCR